MSDIKHVRDAEAIEKIKKLAEDADICLFATQLTQIPLVSRPMSTQKVEEDGSIWFFSNADSNKNQQIQSDPRVQLFYSNRNSSEYLSLYGTARIIRDEAKAKELWGPLLKTWFNGGPDDPNLTLLQVIPEEGYYWDTKDGRIVTMLKIAAGAITGKEIDGSIEGKVRV